MVRYVFQCGVVVLPLIIPCSSTVVLLHSLLLNNVRHINYQNCDVHAPVRCLSINMSDQARMITARMCSFFSLEDLILTNTYKGFPFLY